MLRLPFNGLYIVTQLFGENPQNYSQFLVLYPDGVRRPMKGHNGLDFGTPHRTEVIAPHDGNVIEVLFDAPGYGWYVKLENDIEGSVLGHLDAADVKVGYTVKAGDHLGWSDNTGNSTGPHLHWGYYRFPRDRSNGIAGFIDQVPFLAEAGIQIIEGKLPILKNTTPIGSIEELDWKGNDPTNKKSVQTIIDTWYDVAHGKYRTVTEYQGIETQLAAVKKQLEEVQKADTDNAENLKSYNEMRALGYNTIDDITKALDTKESTNSSLQTENTKLLKRIDVLAGEVQSMAQEDHTTAELGQQALGENKDLKDAMLELTKVTGADKPTLNSIVEKIFNFKDLAERFLKKIEDDEKAQQENEQEQPKKPSLLLQLFKFIPTQKGGEKT